MRSPGRRGMVRRAETTSATWRYRSPYEIVRGLAGARPGRGSTEEEMTKTERLESATIDWVRPTSLYQRGGVCAITQDVLGPIERCTCEPRGIGPGKSRRINEPVIGFGAYDWVGKVPNLAPKRRNV